MPNSGSSKPKSGNDIVVLPTGQIVEWNDWVPTEPRVPEQVPLPASPEYEALVKFFFPKPEPPSEGSTAALCKLEGRCPECG